MEPVISPQPPRDYSLTGSRSQWAVDAGLAQAEWYRTDIPRKRMKELMARSDGRAALDSALWIGLLIGFGVAGVVTWGTWWSAVYFFCYGTLYGSGADSRWHEHGHGTAFKTSWLNEAMYQLASFMMIRNPVVWKWSHTRHHTDTIIVGRDPEIVAERPPKLWVLVANLFGLVDAPKGLSAMVRIASGRLTPNETTYIPESERSKAFWIARIWIVIYTAVVIACPLFGSLLPLMLVGLPRLYGAWHHIMTGVIQHLGLSEDVTDHRMNTRTCYMNPVTRFIYLNMNYHVEHHMFPLVPYHQLPALHQEMKADCPEPCPNILAALREILPVLWAQRHDTERTVSRSLPVTTVG